MTSEALPIPSVTWRGLGRLLAGPVRVIGALVGGAALAALIVYSLRLATAATADPGVLVPSSHLAFRCRSGARSRSRVSRGCSC
jgi:hypothetical protein